MKQSSVKNYFSGAFSELRKVVWPSKTELVKLTIAVIAIGGLFTLFVGVLDFLFNFGYQFLLEI